MKLLEGKRIKALMLQRLKRQIARKGNKPCLAVVLIGDNKASDVYVSLKQKAAGEIDMDFWVLKFSAKDTERDILQAIEELNHDRDIHGIIVQLPLPKKFDAQKIIDAVDPRKDVDGFHPRSIRNYLRGAGTLKPVFPSAIMKLIESSKSKLDGKKAVVVSNSELFGKIMVATLKNKKISSQYILASGLKSTGCDLKEADIVVVAVGKSGIIKGKMLKSGAIVIDGGITKRGDRILGDVDIDSVKNSDICLSPVPGGVGPVTIACLLENVYLAFRKS